MTYILHHQFNYAKLPILFQAIVDVDLLLCQMTSSNSSLFTITTEENTDFDIMYILNGFSYCHLY